MRGFIKWDSRVWLHMCNEGLSKTDFGLLLFIEEYSKMGEKVCTASDEKLAQYLHGLAVQPRDECEEDERKQRGNDDCDHLYQGNPYPYHRLKIE